jgi:hypothetical protein
LIAVAAALCVAACAPEPPPASEAEAAPPRQPTVIDPQLQALDKAKGVESQVLEASRRSIDEADAADEEPR